MSDIYKINHIRSNNIEHIYVFIGEILYEGENYGPKGTKFFDKNEWDNIKSKKIKITIIPHFIHGDDTIIMIKKKIIKFLKLKKSISQLYLFGITSRILNVSNIFQNLSQSGKIEITHDKFCHFLKNIVSNKCDEYEDIIDCNEIIPNIKETYDFDDFLSLRDFEWSDPKLLTIPIGQKLIINEPYLFVANPYNISHEDPIIKKNIDDILTTQNNNLLFESGKLCNNNIFVCFADEVLEFSKNEDKITEEYMTNVYFPILAIKNNVTNLSQLENKKIALFEAQKTTIDNVFVKYNENIDLFFNMFHTKTSDIPYLDNTPGITEIDFTIHPVSKINFPLEILFKLIHSSKNIPMVKYNPGNKRENIYRLFTNDEMSQDGKQIPFLFTANNNKKGLIIKLSKLMATKKRVGFYIITEHAGEKYEIICEFEANGNINIKMSSGKPLTLEKITQIIIQSIENSILKKITNYLEQSGYAFSAFSNFDDKNIEIKNINYVSSIIYKKNIRLTNFIKCLTSVFTIFEGNLTSNTEGIVLRYKRVSNYNEMDSREALINEKSKLGNSTSEIIEALVVNFKMSHQDAQIKYANWIGNTTTEKGLFSNKTFSIRSNTGFPIIIRRNPQNFQITITMENINSVNYLHYIRIYIDSLLRLITDKKSSKIPVSRINTLCKGKKLELKEEEKDDTDIQAQAEKNILDRKDALINDNEVVFESDIKEQTDFLDFLMDDDDESEDDSEDDSEDNSGDDDFDDFGDFGDFGNFDNLDSAKSKDVDLSIKMATKNATPDSLDSIKSYESNKTGQTSEIEVDLTGIPLKNAKSVFMQKKINLQPDLFLKVPKGRFKAYSKACPAQYSKQPMILTKKEKQYIDKKDAEANTKSYDEFITYGTGEEKYHYVCPRFWCLADDEGKSRSISLKEINSGKCGGWDALIPKGSKKVPKGGRIYEFTDNRFHTEGEKNTNIMVYKPMYPGFISGDKHPDGLCVPCCFGKPTTNKDKGKKIKNMFKPVGKLNPEGVGPMYKRVKDGSIDLNSVDGEPQKKDAPAKVRIATSSQCDQGDTESTKIRKSTKKTFDMTPLLETFPLKSTQLGYPSMAEQKFLGFNCQKICQKSLSDKQLKLGTACLLHKGMEKSETKSFLAVIADIYYYIHNIDEFNSPIKSSATIKITINDLIKIIVDKLNIDIFISLQNGDLVELFYKEKKVEVGKYKSSKLYKTISPNIKNENFDAYFKKVISAYENFIDYLKDPKSIIDYEYLWDFITMSKDELDGGLFEAGLNIILIRSPQDDITNKIEIVCPTNQYSSNNFNIKKQIVFIYSKGSYFEPIYKYKRVRKDKYEITKLFYLKELKKTMPEISHIVKIVWNNLENKCKPLPSMPEKYNNTLDFKENINADKIIKILSKNTLKYKVISQIVNFQNNVIGIYASNGANKIYIPSIPSSINQNLSYTFIHDPTLWGNYKYTLKQLDLLHKKSKGEIYCKPMIKIVDQRLSIIGILTETNQMVPTIPSKYTGSIDDKELDGIKAIHINSDGDNMNYLNLDASLFENKKVDEERTKKIKEIQLESHFYNVFRNLLRILLNNFEYRKQNNKFITIIEDPVITYNVKLIEIIKNIKMVMQNDIEFVDIRLKSLTEIDDIIQCLNLDKDACEKNTLCIPSSGDKCKLKLPKINLVNQSNNEIIYYGKLADELIRFKNIRTFILTPHNFLSFQQIPYNLKKNEIILLEELLYGDYFDDLKAVHQNDYITTRNIYDLVEPNNGFPYQNNFNLNIEIKDEEPNVLNSCVISNNTKLSLGHWKDKNLTLLREKKKPEDIKKEIRENKIINKPLLSNFELLEYKHNFKCSWEIIATIINNFGISIKTPDIVKILVDIYTKLFRTQHKDDVLKILKRDGKVEQTNSLIKGTSLVDIITLSNYYLTLIDIFLLVKHFEIPCLVLCRTKMPLFDKEYISFMGGVSSFSYIIFSGKFQLVNSATSPVYGIISNEESFKIPNILFDTSYDKLLQNNINDIQEFINMVVPQKLRFKKGAKLKAKKK